MKNIILIANKPWRFIDLLQKFMDETGCSVEVIFGYKNLRVYYAESELYETVKESFPDSEIKCMASEKDFAVLEEYFSRNDTVFLIEVELDTDISFKYGLKKLKSEKIFYFAQYEDSLSLIHDTFESSKCISPALYHEGRYTLRSNDFEKIVQFILEQ